MLFFPREGKLLIAISEFNEKMHTPKQKYLAEITGLSFPQVRRNIATLKKRNYIVDYPFRITPQGNDFLQECLLKHNQAFLALKSEFAQKLMYFNPKARKPIYKKISLDQLFEYLKNYINTHKVAPSRERITKDLGAERNKISEDLKKLELEGRISIEPYVPCGIKLTEKSLPKNEDAIDAEILEEVFEEEVLEVGVIVKTAHVDSNPDLLPESHFSPETPTSTAPQVKSFDDYLIDEVLKSVSSKVSLTFRQKESIFNNFYKIKDDEAEILLTTAKCR